MDAEIIFKKTRIAPTPSGFSHLGNVLSFAITAALARKAGAKILLRIDDLDQNRVNRDYVQDIFDTLHFLDIPWDEGPGDFTEYEKEYSQLHRMELYRQALKQLEENGDLFACSCSRREILRDNADGAYPGTCRQKKLSLDGAAVNWRLCTAEARELVVKTLNVGGPGLAMPDGKSLTGKTLVVDTLPAGERDGRSAEGTGRTPEKGFVIAPLPAAMQDFIVRKKDHFPAYQLTSLLDDLYYGIDLIIRGEDLWPSTLAQQYLSFSLQQDRFRDIHFYHHPLLMESQNRKLSKSAGDTSVRYLRQQGLTPADIYSRIAGMLGKQEAVGNWKELTEVLGLLELPD